MDLHEGINQVLIRSDKSAQQQQQQQQKGVVERSEKIRRLTDALAKHRIVLVWSAPGTGKTSLLGQMAAAISGEGRKVGILSLTDARWSTMDFYEYFRRSTGEGWDTFLEAPRGDGRVLLIDEAQVIYQRHADDFWMAIKYLSSLLAEETGVQILIFAAYADNTVQTSSEFSTPFAPRKRFGADFLQLTDTEMDGLLSDFNERNGHLIPDQTKEVILRFTLADFENLVVLLSCC
jgi:chromosomal replication initiation ATPase DnaA